MAEIVPVLLKPAEAAEFLSLGESTIYRMAASGELPSVKIGRSVRFRRADLIEYANNLEPAGVAPRRQEDEMATP